MEGLMTIDEMDVIKLLYAILIGGLLGAEREYRDKAAGFRTIIMICVGATLFTIFSDKISDTGDPGRIAAQIVSGVGFLGAGAILREGLQVKGLTTASTIWLAAALGMGIGIGFFGLVGLATLFLLVVLWLFPVFELWIDSRRELRTYELIHDWIPDKDKNLENLFKKHHLQIFDNKQFKREGKIISEWVTHGTPANHNLLVESLFADTDIKEFTY
jgi:putative Mg2+ transporter-C (MgtC) family protein